MPERRTARRSAEVYTCEGDDLSPPLEWSGAARAQSLVSSSDDRMRPTPGRLRRCLCAWVLFDCRPIPPRSSRAWWQLHTAQERLTMEAHRLRRSVSAIGRTAYFFRLYALEQARRLSAGTSRRRGGHAGHVLAEAQTSAPSESRIGHSNAKCMAACRPASRPAVHEGPPRGSSMARLHSDLIECATRRRTIRREPSGLTRRRRL